MVEKFIRNLKTVGVLKSVKNNDNQFEMSDLVEDDIEVSDETAVSEECLYVFTYVGVIICGSKVIKAYPKYLVREKKDYFWEMRQVIKVLERYNRSDEQMISMFNGAGENRSFNLLAVILYLLNDYFEYGIPATNRKVRIITICILPD